MEDPIFFWWLPTTLQKQQVRTTDCVQDVHCSPCHWNLWGKWVNTIQTMLVYIGSFTFMQGIGLLLWYRWVPLALAPGSHSHVCTVKVSEEVAFCIILSAHTQCGRARAAQVEAIACKYVRVVIIIYFQLWAITYRTYYMTLYKLIMWFALWFLRPAFSVTWNALWQLYPILMQSCTFDLHNKTIITDFSEFVRQKLIFVLIFGITMYIHLSYCVSMDYHW